MEPALPSKNPLKLLLLADMTFRCIPSAWTSRLQPLVLSLRFIYTPTRNRGRCRSSSTSLTLQVLSPSHCTHLSHTFSPVIKNPPQDAHASFQVGDDGGARVSGVSRSAGSLSGRSPLRGVDVYFAAKVVVLGGKQKEQPSGNVWCNGTLNSSSASSALCVTSSSSCGVWLQFPSCSTTGCSLLLATSISFVSSDQAWANMDAELPSVTTPPEHLFQTVVNRTQQIWRENLSRVTVGASTPRETAVKLYTAVYHTLMAPSIFSEGQIYPPPAALQSPSLFTALPSSSGSTVYRSFDGSVHPWPHALPYLTDMSMYCPHRTYLLFPLCHAEP